MILSITGIKDRGDLTNERIVMKVVGTAELGEYLVLRTTFIDGNITTGIHNTFWFPDEKVDSGDIVVLYTKKGRRSKKALASGGQSHFFYWGRPEALWGSADRAAVVLRAADWEVGAPE